MPDIPNTEPDMGDALLDAVRLQLGQHHMEAAVRVIPIAKDNPVLTANILIEAACTAIRAYAEATGINPVEAVDQLWPKPTASTESAP